MTKIKIAILALMFFTIIGIVLIYINKDTTDINKVEIIQLHPSLKIELSSRDHKNIADLINNINEQLEVDHDMAYLCDKTMVVYKNDSKEVYGIFSDIVLKRVEDNEGNTILEGCYKSDGKLYGEVKKHLNSTDKDK